MLNFKRGNIMAFKIENISCKVISSLNKLFVVDRFLLKHNLNERTITHQLAIFLQEEFQDWNVDCEYNRIWRGGKISKKAMNLDDIEVDSDDTEGSTVFPDIIIHHREDLHDDKREDNLLCIEIKKSKNRLNLDKDVKKLKKFTSLDEFNYQFGLNLILPTGNDYEQGKPVKLHWFEDGVCFLKSELLYHQQD